MATIEESGLKFQFDDEQYSAVKFDEMPFYRDRFNKLPGGKGVDIIANSKEILQLIEIKNCIGHEVDNIWRTSNNNTNLQAAPKELDISDRDSFDIEIAKKIASTLTCLYGAWTKSESSEKASEMAIFWDGLNVEGIKKDQKKIVIILFLEGDFDKHGPRSRSKKMIMKSIKDSIETKLSWLNCRVTVVDSSTYKKKYFEIV